MTRIQLTTTSFFDGSFPSFISTEIKNGNEHILIVYDLHNGLSGLECDLKAFDEILDIYLLESIIHLGKYHKNYFESEQDIPTYGLQKYLHELVQQEPNRATIIPTLPVDFWQWLIAYAFKLKNRAIQDGVWEHYQTVELPFAISLSSLSQNGVALNASKIGKIRSRIGLARQKLYAALDVNNVGGPSIRDLNDWVKGYGFDEYFPAGRDEISMKDLALLEDQHQVFKIFLRLEKLKRIERILEGFGDQTATRPFYKTMGAVTGRCTSKHPNIMGIPKIFRPVVVPSRIDFGIVECDYSQMEVGIAAGLSDDENLIDDFNHGDVYEEVGKNLFGKEKGISRSKAKVLFLGIQYGLSINTIAKRLRLTSSQASAILERLYNRYGRLHAFLQKQEALGTRRGFVESISGLRRYRFDPRKPPNYWERNWFKNFPVQSSAMSVFKRSIIQICSELSGDKFNLLVPLYDSVVFEAPLRKLKEVTDVVVGCMVASMRELFPKLRPKVAVNDADTSCWNAEGKGSSIEEFLRDPLAGIDIRGKPSANIEWSKYL